MCNALKGDMFSHGRFEWSGWILTFNFKVDAAHVAI